MVLLCRLLGPISVWVKRTWRLIGWRRLCRNASPTWHRSWFFLVTTRSAIKQDSGDSSVSSGFRFIRDQFADNWRVMLYTRSYSHIFRQFGSNPCQPLVPVRRVLLQALNFGLRFR